jgi:acyl transferase domain-containing protein
VSESESGLRKALDQALFAIEKLKSRQASGDARNEPIAIVGVGCRYPGGVRDLETFWRMLDDGVDAVREVPRERWNAEAHGGEGKPSTASGGFLDRIEEFDAGFFGIAPREAVAMDPQQRLLLETSWEALEHAGIAPTGLVGSPTGVFVGMCSQEYGLLAGIGAEEEHGAYLATGNTPSVASGRISYVLGLQGPSMTVDTACSSSLVTVHLACQALRSGECGLALAGGSNLLLTPAGMSVVGSLQALSPTGRCRTFSADADGFVRSEGVGVVVLERLSDAQRNGHQVLALVRGSAVNQDGRSNGLTAPNGPSQEAVIREALRRAGVAPSSIDYLECHGTGTPLGDPIEVQAAAAVLGEGRAERPLWLSSLKSNIGHAEGAAGVGGLIKAVLSLRHGRIPASLHFSEPNPHIAWSALPVRVVSKAVEWPREKEPRRAGVSSFGISGTNAHVVLEEAPASASSPSAPERSTELVVLSGRTAEALSATAGRLAEHLERRAEAKLGDVAYSLATTRSQHRHRLSVTVRSREELIGALQEARRGEAPSGSTRGEARSGGTAWLFTGQGSQRVGMGKELAETWPVFGEALAEAMRALDAHLDVPLRAVMWAEAGTAEAKRLGETEYAQPALFAVGAALAALWRSWGIRPDYVMGHSVGELTAAHVAGVLTLSDAAKLVAARGRLMQRLPEAGAMVSLAAPEAEVAKALAGFEATVAIAAVNGPESTVISGAEDAVMRIAEGFASRGIRTKRLEVSHAFHSPLMEPMLEEFRRVAESVPYGRAELPLVSNVSGTLSTGEVSTAAYWVGHVRAAVRFADGVQTLHTSGVKRYVELGPKATLLGLVSSCVAGEEPDELLLVPSLRAERSEDVAVLEALGALHAHGASVDFQGVFPSGGRRVELPTYAWQRQRYWLERRSKEEGASIEELERLSNAGALSEPARAALPEVLSALRSERAKREVSAWFYALAWRRAALRSGANASGRWLVLDDGSGLAEALSAALARGGAETEVFERPWGERLRSSLASVGEKPTRVVLCAAAEGIEVEAIDALRACEASEQAEPTCWVLTRGAVSADGEELTSPSGAVLWGMGKSFGLEHPRRWGGLVDVGTELGEEEASRAVAWIGGEAEAQGEEHLAVRKEGDWVQRLVRRGVPEPKGKAWSTAGAALVTGGLGRIGLQVARWLVSRGVKHLVVTGRRGLRAPGAEAAVAELRALGAEITVGEVDVADLGAMKAFAATLTSPVTAIFHAAGVLDDATPFLKLNGERLGRVLSAKRDGTLVLEELGRAWPLDTFVAFSSGAGVWGFGGAVAYAGANAYLDGWAEAARRRGIPATSIAWGAWSGTQSSEEGERWLERRGMRAMPVEGALLAMERVLLSGLVQAVVADIEWTAFRKGYESWRRRALLLELDGANAAGATPETGPTGPEENTWRSELLPLPEQKRREVVLEVVRGEVARVLSMPNASSVPADRPLKELGLDSLMAVELRNALGKRTGTRLPAALAFDHPTATEITKYLLERVLSVTAIATSSNAPAFVSSQEEAIAIVGLGCRYPGGVEDAASFWRLLDEGVDAVAEVPAERWDIEDWYDRDPDAAGKMTTRWGGFLSGLDRFEPGFFDISPREALGMDPQLRLLLETTWEAIEGAGLVADQLMGSDTGVFMGLTAFEYLTRALGDASNVDVHRFLGSSPSSMVQRLSYWLGLKGPNMPVDTACSSSLVAVHLACQALRSGECSLALAGGANVTLDPEGYVLASRLRALSPTGRCHTFSAAADGYVRSEGAGVVLLERLSDAQRNGRRVLGVIRGSAVNQDGRSNGLTAPNGPSQEAVIRQALRRAGILPSRVGYLECHGTGTALGDPLEVEAAAAVLGEGRTTDAPLVLGSLKSNIGHAEAAAGVGGLIKAVLSLRHERIPKSLHSTDPSPHIPWSELPVKVASEAVPWPRGETPRFAGVSSFGLSGTNAHVVLEEAPAEPSMPSAPSPRAELFVLSGRTAESLSAAAGRLAEHLERHAEAELGDVAYSLATTRKPHQHRLSLTARSREELLGALNAASTGELPKGGVRAESRPGAQVVFVFPGQGSQWVGMGRELLEEEPVFREAMEACDRAIQAEAGWSVLEALGASAEPSRLDEIDVVQPVLFSMGVSLAALWRSWGVEPRAVVGHSQGEVVAAYVAGAISLEQAARVVCRRSRLLRPLMGKGEMAQVQLTAREAEAAIAGHEEELCIAATNSRRSTTLSGSAKALSEVLTKLEGRGVSFQRIYFKGGIRSSVASHSPQMDPLRAELETVLAEVSAGTPKLRMVSTVTGEQVKAGELSAAYWSDNLRKPVQFASVVEKLLAEGPTLFVEVSPHPVLLPALEEIRSDAEVSTGTAVGSLYRNKSERHRLLSALGALHAHGASVNFQGVFTGGGRRVELPTYAWQRQRYWLERRPKEEVSVAHLEQLSLEGGLSESARAALPEVVSALRSERERREVSSFFYALAWRRAELRGGAKASGRWLVLDDGSGLAGALSDALVRAGAEPEVVERPWGEKLRSSLTDTPARVVLCAAAEGIELEAIDALRACEASERAEPRSWIVTRGAVSVDGEELMAPSGAVLWGMGKSFGLEHPRRWGGLVDVGTELGEEEASRAVAWMGGEAEAHGEEHLAVRKEGDWVQRLVRKGVPETRGRVWSTAGAALVTGGLGRVGTQVARWLVSRGVKHVVVTSRRGLRGPGAEAAVAELRALGAEITVGEVDVADRTAMKAFAETLTTPITAIFHAAGVLDDMTPFLELDGERLGRVLSAKREGTLVLEELGRGWPLDTFVCFSSAAAVWGVGGTSAYAGANAYLDAWAEAARRRGVPATSIAWGLWSGTATSEEHERWLGRRGVPPMSVERALLAMERVLLSGRVQAVVANVEWTAFRRNYKKRALLMELDGADAAGATPETGPVGSAWRSELLLLPEQKRREVVLEVVRGEVARVLSMPSASSVPADRPLKELGIDSLLALDLRNALSERVGTKLPATLVFDYPSPAAIAEHLLEKALSLVEASPRSSAPSAVHSSDEPIAVVGLGCRYPGGVEDAVSFWRLLDEGVDAVTEVPAERWDIEDWYDRDPDAAGKMTTRWGGFLSGLDRFEPGFFDISPREALGMDPQLRLLLETTWEAIEGAGLVADQLMGSDTGVFMGLTGSEYLTRALGDPLNVDIHGLFGSSLSSMVQRISYWLGLKGPNMPVDTACSSSLVAVHLACQALRSGECSLALAGGASVTLDPEQYVVLSRLRAQSPTGRCHTFSAAADGFVRSEGAGVVLLERLSDAQRKGHRVLGLIRASAVNQDGRSNGLAAPNGPSQEAVIREALRRGGVAPSSVGYLECHGTGTTLGDPIEVQAAAAVLGEGRTADTPLVLGSFKSNIGHAEAAAGVGGLIKAVLSLRHERIPKSLHFKEPNPHIPWSDLPVKVASESMSWPRGEKPRLAGVSSFGISGTNAHVVVEEAPIEASRPSVPERSAELVVLSGRTAEALSATAGRLAEDLERHAEAKLGDVAYSLATTRTHHEHRLSLAVRSREELIGALQEARRGEVPSGSTRAEARSGGTAWLFTGQGSQRVGMGKELAEAWPVFREALAEAMRALDAHLDVPLRAVMWAEAGTAEAKRLGETEYAQPALFAVGAALAALWRSWGVRPDYVMGHSVGELTAAHVAGVLTLSDAAKLVAARGRLMQRLPEAGAMVSVAATEAEVAKALAGSEATVAIAAVNGPESTVISGAEDAVMRIAEGFASRGIRTKRLEVSHAFHSPLMEPMLEEFQRVAESVPYGRAELPLVSNVSGTLSTGEVSTAAYWVGHVRATVRFADGVQTLHASGVKRYVELGPKATLLGLVSSCVAGEELAEVSLVASLREERAESRAALEALGALHAHGAQVDFQGVFAGVGRRVELPTYAWQRQRYWLERRPKEEVSIAHLERLSKEGGLSESALAALPEVVSALRSERERREVSSFFYALAWRRAELRGGAKASGRWLVLDDGSGLAGALSAALTRGGAETEVFERPWGERLRSSLASVGEKPTRVVLCVAVEGIEVEAIEALSACESIGQAERSCWVVTRGAVAANGEELTAPFGAVLWGMGKSFGLEHPRRWGGLVDVGVELGEEEAARAVAWMSGEAEAQGEEHLAVRKEGDWVQRLVRKSVPETRGRVWSTTGAALVTGGLGRIGLQVARWLVSRGVKHLVVTSRRGLRAPGAEAAVAELRTLGAEITVGEVDVADRAAMKAFAATLTSPVTAIFHAAGVLDDATPFLELDGERLGRVLSAKREGTLVLEELSRAWPVDTFVAFSSGAGVWGFGGTSAYAGANAYLDAWAEAARRRGVPATSIAWGMWSGTASEEEHERWLERRGVRAMPVERALLAMERVLLSGRVQAVVTDMEWTAFRKGYESWRRRALLLELEGANAAGATPETVLEGSTWRSELLPLPEQERREVALEVVRGEVARVLSMPNASSVPADRPLKELGLDSLMAVELRDRLSRRVGMTLPATLAFDYPIPDALATHLLEKVLPEVETRAAGAPAMVLPGTFEEPIAIVGLGCRYPGGVTDPESLWRLLDNGVDAITEIPSERWDVDAFYDSAPEAVGKMVTRWGGFLSDLERFDPTFFELSAREAVSTDPQLRLMLETSWEALERAGITAGELMGSRTGVFMGLIGGEYVGRAVSEGYDVLGGSPSSMVGRLSYWLGLKGPSMPIDTACSSSLVAVHLACQALRTGECTLALAGGANVTLDPVGHIVLSRMQALSPTGRCHTFSNEADGYVRSEGAGVVVLERLSDARRNGHPVLALIRGSAVNQDGRSNGPTAPNGPSQEAVIREALGRAGIAASSVGYLECHGTGTSLGDPIEVQAAASAFGDGREAERPLVLGSLKSNVGHTETAAGVGGLIKAVLSLKHGRIPKSLHTAGELNSHIPWSELPVKVATEAVDWPRADAPRYAGVSAFGISGTNAHVIVEEAPDAAILSPRRAERPAELVVLSGKTSNALDASASRLLTHLASYPELELADVAYTSATARTHHRHRLTVSTRTRAELVNALERLTRGESVEGARSGQVPTSSGKQAWLFTGQGSQSLGMGRGLSEAWPAFRSALEAAWKALDVHLELPLRDVMWAEPGTHEATLLHETAYTQPALFAFEWALAALWRSWGVKPDFVAGHSIGEVTAACVAGIFSLEDAARLVVARGRLMQQMCGRGTMMALEASEAAVADAVAAHAETVSIAAVNAHDSVVISGVESAVLAIAEGFAQQGVRTKRLAVSHAFHSPLMDPMLDELRRVAEGVSYGKPEVPIASNLGGTLNAGELSTADYWVRHVRAAVRFADGVRALREAGVTRFVEIGPLPILSGLASGVLAEDDGVSVTPSLRPNVSEATSVLDALGHLHVQGSAIDWAGVFPAGGRRVDLPTYPWQRERYWIERGSAGIGDFGRVTAATALVETDETAPTRKLLQTIRQRLHVDSNQPPEATIAELGIDSLGLAELRSLIYRLPGGKELSRRALPTVTASELLADVDALVAKSAGAQVASFDSSTLDELLEGAEWTEVTAPSVNKRTPANVLLERAARVEDSAVAELRMQPTHPFFYEREIDHVPGMYLIEAGRQFGNWITFSHVGKLAAGATLDRVESEFFQYVEHDAPCYLVARRSPDGTGMAVYLVQSSALKAVLTFSGRRIEDQEYARLRAAQRNEGDLP